MRFCVEYNITIRGGPREVNPVGKKTRGQSTGNTRTRLDDGTRMLYSDLKGGLNRIIPDTYGNTRCTVYARAWCTFTCDINRSSVVTSLYTHACIMSF